MTELKKDEIISTIRTCHDDASAHWNTIYERAKSDIEFANIEGSQWTAKEIESRKASHRPHLEFNKLHVYISQEVNNQRQNRPAIKLRPVDNGADIDTAEILNGLLRDIEQHSNAADAYDMAYEHAVTGGIGFIRILTDYADGESFNQEIMIKRVVNPFGCYLDPLSKEADGSDAMWAMCKEWIGEDVFKRQYPKAEPISFDGNSGSDWVNGTDKTVCVADFYRVEFDDDVLYLLPDGRTAYKSDVGELAEGMYTKQRTVQRRKVMWYKVNGQEVLEKTEWPSQYMPLIPVYGKEVWVENKRTLNSLITHAKGAQRLYNMERTTVCEQLSQAPKVPWLAEEGQIEEFAEEWKDANNPNRVFLPYKGVSVNGVAIPPPQRISPPITPAGNISGAMMANDDIKATTGVFDASLGAQGNETSGKAILARQSESDQANFHFIDNLNRAIRQVGKVLVELVQRVYDVPRVVRILGIDQQPKMVMINQPPEQLQRKIDGIEAILGDISIGRYDVSVDTGPSYKTQRMEQATMLQELVRAYPPLMEIAGDKGIRSLDGPEMQAIADRLEKRLPPELRDAEGEENPEVQQITAQFEQQMQQLQAALQEAQAAANDKQAERELKLSIEILKAENALDIAQVQAASRSDVEELRGALEMIKQQMTPPANWMQAGELAPQIEPYAQSMPMQPQQMQPEPPPEQMMQQDPPSAGFSLPEIQDFNAPDDGQIGMDAPPMAAVNADLSQPNDMPEM